MHKKNKYEAEIYDEREMLFGNKKKKKPIITNITLSLMLVIATLFSIFLIIDAPNRINETYQIINASLILLIAISIVISFPKAFFKNKSGSTTFTSVLIISTLIFNGLYLLNIIKLPTQKYLPDFYNKSMSEVIEWTNTNNLEHEEIFEYSDNIKKYNVINQNKKPKTLIKNIKNIKFMISNGPDYNKEVIIPDMSGWTTDEVLKFVEKNHLKNVQILFEENKEIKNDIVIKQSTVGKIKRSDSIIFTASLGDINALTPTDLQDLKGQKLLNAETYLGKHGILYELKYEFSDKIKRGKIISSNKEKGTIVNPNDKIILTVSKGKEIKVPEIKNMSLGEVTKWIIENNLDIEYTDKYDSEIEKGKAISANYKTGDIIEEETKVNVIFSKGKLVMPKFENLESFKAWANNYNIKYEIKEEFNKDIAQNSIIKFSVNENEEINIDEPITVLVSKGESITTPDFIGKTKSEIQKECNNLAIICTFTNTKSNKTEGTAITQSIAKGTEIPKGQNINIEIAVKKQAEEVKSSSAKNTTSKNNSSNSNNQTNTSTNENNCETLTIRLNGSEIKANDPAGTCSTLKGKYGNAIKCEYTPSDSGTNGFILNSRDINGKTASTCNPVTVKIVKNN